MKEIENIIHLESVGSTNDYLRGLHKSQFLSNWTAVYTDFQEKGKGQRGNVWSSAKGDDLLCSIIYRAKNLSPQMLFLINEWVSLSLVNVLREIGAANVEIKWPNDILINKKKVCGILVENTLAGNKVNDTIIGIGLNLNSNALPLGATSLKNELITTIDKKKVLIKILKQLRLNEDLVDFRIDYLKKEYLSNLLGFKEKVLLQDAEGKWEGQVLNVLPTGIIQIEKNGEVKEFGYKEVKWLGKTS